jgi:hypothetical protein
VSGETVRLEAAKAPATDSPRPTAEGARNELGVDGVVGHHLNPYRSGVARFNQVLAARLGVPVVGLFERWESGFSSPLLSFKPAELSPHETHVLEGIVGRLRRGSFRVFLHEFADLAAERALVEKAEIAYCGNDLIHERVTALAANAVRAWAPGLVLDTRAFEPVEISVFSFGMAHKVRTDMFERLRELLEATRKSYALYMSNANHETSQLEDVQVVFDAMQEVFPRGLYFMGNLSDVAVSNYLTRATFFAAFFRDGVRANNTSVASAMEHGAVVITNLDRHSPRHLVHMENVIDIDRCERLPCDPGTLERLSAAAAQTAQALSWDRLIDAMGAAGDT